jgi:hypothetical protein
MKITPKNIKISELVNSYTNNDEEGVIGYSGKLNIRPKYQREFVYGEKERSLVVDTVFKGFPLSVFYWAVNDKEGYEIIDGQQRTISICEYVEGNFSINHPLNNKDSYFHTLKDDEQKKILDYEILVYFCDGEPSEKLAWFEVINIAGKVLTDQELRNAVYSGPWVTDARKYFSKTGCYAFNVAGDYLNGTAIRQDYLETIIKWVSNNDINKYMSKHQFDKDANKLKEYFDNVFKWVNDIYPNYRKDMKGIDWGFLYNEYKNVKFNYDNLEKKIQELYKNEEVTKQKGIFSYLIDGDERKLSLKSFTPQVKARVYEKQSGQCIKPDGCGETFEISEMDADHIIPWNKNGKTIEENCQLLCASCNRSKKDR